MATTASTALNGQTYDPGNAAIATVSVVVTDNFGYAVPGAKLTLTSVVPGEKFTGAGSEVKFERVPFGIYDINVELKGFLKRNERIDVSQHTLLLQIGIALGATHSQEQASLSGTIKWDAGGKRKNLWVRLMPIYSSELVEDAVDGSGKFELTGMAHGEYLLLLFEGSRPLATEPVHILGGKQTVELNVK